MATGARAAARDLAAPPAALLDEVDERCRALAATAVGRVFTVPAGDAEAALRSESRSSARYDTVLSFMCTSQVTSLEDYVAAVEQVLADEGWILMVEPADVVSVVRSRGLFVTDLHRREATSVPPEWRQYVVLRARRQSPQSVGT